MTTWTHFYDMHSGGGCKTDYEQIAIPLPESEAVDLFDTLFGRDPYHTTCDCCGQDYSITESEGAPEWNDCSYRRAGAHAIVTRVGDTWIVEPRP